MRTAIAWLTILGLVAAGCAGAPSKPTESKPTVAGKSSQPKVQAPKISRQALAAYREAVALYRQQKKSGRFDYEGLRQAFQRVLEIDKKMAEAHYNLGCIAEAVHDDKLAVQHYRQALKIRPDLAPAAANWGALLAHHGKLNRALQVYRRALSKEARNSAVLLNMAEIYRQQKKYDQAIKAASDVLIRDPSNVGAYRIMASVYYEKGDLDMAHLICLQGLKVRAQDPRLLNTLGLVMLQMKKIPEALANFRTALAKAPDMLGTRFNIAKVAMDYKDFRVAREQFAKIIEYQPDNRQAAIGLGIALRGEGKHEAARKHFEALSKRWPEWALPHYWLGVLALRNLNDTRAALGEFKKFVKMSGSRLPSNHPVFASIKEARQNIEMERKMKEMEKRAQEEARRQAELEKKLADERVRRLDAAWKKAASEGEVLPPRKLDARNLPFILLPPAICPDQKNKVTIYGMKFAGIKQVKIGNIPVKWKQIDNYTLVMLIPKWLGADAKANIYGAWDVTLFYRDKHADPIIFKGGLWVGKRPPKPKQPKTTENPGQAKPGQETKETTKGKQDRQSSPGEPSAPAAVEKAGASGAGQAAGAEAGAKDVKKGKDATHGKSSGSPAGEEEPAEPAEPAGG